MVFTIIAWFLAFLLLPILTILLIEMFTSRQFGKAQVVPIWRYIYWCGFLGLSQIGYNVKLDQNYKRELTPFTAVYLLGQWILTARSWKYAKDISLDTNTFPKLVTAQFRGTFMERCWTDMVIMSNGDNWKYYRRILNPAMQKQWSTDLFGHLANLMLQEWNKYKANQNGDVLQLHVTDWMQRITVDVVGEATMSTSFHALIKEHDEDAQKLLYNYNECMKGMNNPLFVMIPVIKILSPLIPSAREWLHQMQVFDNFLYNIIETRQAHILEAKKESGPLQGWVEKDLLDCMLLYEKEPMTRVQIRDNLVAFFIAGHDTTANSLSAVLYYMARYPDVQQRVYDEVMAVTGLAQPDDYIPSNAEQRDFIYMTAVIKESLRLSPSLSFLPGRTVSKSTQFDEYLLPQGTVLTIDVAAVHRDPTVFPKPNQFDPTRFLDDTGTQLRLPDPPGFFAFGGGQRICMGMQFSFIEQRTILSMILRKYKIQLPKDSIHQKELICLPGLVMSAKDLYLDFIQR